MITREEKHRRRQLFENRSSSPEETAWICEEFNREVILKPEYYDIDRRTEECQVDHCELSQGRQTMNERVRSTPKMLGDAGENYAMARFGFLGIPCAKMPDNWPEYDFVLDVGGVVQKVGVRTRSETRSFSKSSWFLVDADAKIDWSVFVISRSSGDIIAWVVPQEKCLVFATPNSAPTRHISWRQLESPDLVRYKENWTLQK